jgi:hypothetical protein
MSESYDTQSSVQYGQELDYYINGFGISNDATTPNTLLDIAPGSCLDSTGTYQLNSNAVLTINAAVNGLNGLDTGTFTASKVYAVYVVWDPVTFLPTGGMLSLSYTQPLMPFGYSAFLLIGYATTDSSAHFLKGYWSAGNTSSRTFTYDAPIQCLSGNQTSYTGVDLSAFVPAVDNTPVTLFSNFAANAAADVENLQGYNSTGDAVTIIAPVAGATAHTTQQNIVLAQLHTGAPSIKYKVSAGSLVLDVCAYQWFV